VITRTTDVLLKPDTLAPAAEDPISGRVRSERCARIKDLGFTASRHIKMYGERFELVSDPFNEGDCIAVHAISGGDPKVRTLRLPVAILVGVADRLRKRAS
jgi:hypothetical protein